MKACVDRLVSGSSDSKETELVLLFLGVLLG